MRLSDFKVLSFDTYGTLIDWETGILESLQPLLGQMQAPPANDEVLRQFGQFESRWEDEAPDMLYAHILENVYLELARSWGLRESVAQAEDFGRSVGKWPAFPDSAEALAYLKRHFKLVTLTNCDRENYAGSAARLGHPWDLILTAEDIGSYKPSLLNFDYLLRFVRNEFECDKADILHVAQSLYHDHVPAGQVGLVSCWINRRVGKAGGGAARPPEEAVSPAFEFPSMARFAAAHRAEQ
jgi:2-haloacid dehalogenase/putative hydrolase of the HAD superfamily